MINARSKARASGWASRLSWLKRFVFIVFGCVFLYPFDCYGQAGTLAVSAFFSGLNDSIDKLEASGHSLIDHGNIAAGQQQMLLAATLRATIEQVKKAYEDDMNKTFDRVDSTRRSTFQNLNQLVSQADEIRKQTVTDAQNTIYMTAGQANVLLGRLPFAKRFPVYFGAVPKNVLSAVTASPVDLELLGFYLSDPEIPSHIPEIKINGTPIPSDKISAKFDRIQVQFPDSLRSALRLKNTACDPMRSFTAELRVYYTNHPAMAKYSDYFVDHSDFREFVAPGKPLFEVSVVVDGKVITDGLRQDGFHVTTGQVTWGCDMTRDTSVAYTAAEPNATIISARAHWESVDGKYENNPSCSQTWTGNTATASGSVRGANSVGVDLPFGVHARNCPGGGHGELQMDGTYQHPAHSEEVYHYDNTAAFGDSVSISTPVREGLRIDKAHVEIRRKGCSNLVDQLDIYPSGATSQTSKGGFFLATMDGNQLTVKGTDLLK